ncbi:MAG: enoyl-CoA hydratase-related protein [Bacteroidia bacterium]
MSKLRHEFIHNGSVVRMILDDGKGNVVDHLMMEEIQHALNSFKSNNNLKLIIFEGAGKHFSFGASVEEHQKDSAAAMLTAFHALFLTLRDLAIPCASKISGQCLGGGLELALMSNFMFADKTAKLGQPEIALGVFPPPASILLPEKIGLAKAEELIITGKIIGADEALRIGLLNEVYPDKETLDVKVEEWIHSYILPRSASSLRFAVQASRIKFNHVLSNFLPQLESLYLNKLMETHDANEGINSFIEKRKPNWINN